MTLFRYFWFMVRLKPAIPGLVLLLMMQFNTFLHGQDGAIPPVAAAEGAVSAGSSWSVGSDLVSSYIWRGSRQGSGPHIQPFLEFSAGCFTTGAWGTVDLNGYEEADLWFSFEVPGGFTVGIQDYYLPELPLFDLTASDGSHALEANLGWTSNNVWLSANCIVNKAGGVGSMGGDLYFEAGLSFDYFSLFLGAGNGWHTAEGSFRACNTGLEVTREIKITDRFSLPLTARMVFNPDRGQMFVTAGLSLDAGLND